MAPGGSNLDGLDLADGEVLARFGGGWGLPVAHAEGLLSAKPDDESARRRVANVCGRIAMLRRDQDPAEAISLAKRAYA